MSVSPAQTVQSSTAVPTQPLAPTPYRCPVCGRMSPARADAPVRPGCYACGKVGTTRPLAGALSISTDRFVMVPSDSIPGVEYKCSANGCGCAAFYFGRLNNPAFRCKHMVRKFPPVRLCPVCHLNPITDLSTCSDKCSQAARKLDMAIRVDAPVVVEQARPACPGYLKAHAAVDGVSFCWCSLCDERGGGSMSAQFIVRYGVPYSARMKTLRDPNRPSRVQLFDSEAAAAIAAKAIEDVTTYWIFQHMPPIPAVPTIDAEHIVRRGLKVLGRFTTREAAVAFALNQSAEDQRPYNEAMQAARDQQASQKAWYDSAHQPDPSYVGDSRGGETAEEPPFAEQERAAGNYDGEAFRRAESAYYAELQRDSEPGPDPRYEHHALGAGQLVGYCLQPGCGACVDVRDFEAHQEHHAIGWCAHGTLLNAPCAVCRVPGDCYRPLPRQTGCAQYRWFAEPLTTAPTRRVAAAFSLEVAMSIEEIRALLDEAHTLLARVWDSPDTPPEITDRVH